MHTVDRQHTLIGRFNQILFDGPPSMMLHLYQPLRLDKNVLKSNLFKIKDFYSYAQ
jgi:hypothetical protein